jgi:hypothetical protein
MVALIFILCIEYGYFAYLQQDMELYEHNL